MYHLSGHSSTSCTVLGIRTEHGFVGVCALTSLLQKVEYERTKHLGKLGRKAMKYQQMSQAGDSSIWVKQTITVTLENLFHAKQWFRCLRPLVSCAGSVQLRHLASPTRTQSVCF